MIQKKLDKNPDTKDALGLEGLRLRKYRYKPWDNDEREKFTEAVKKYGKNLPLICKHVGTKNYR